MTEIDTFREKSKVCKIDRKCVRQDDKWYSESGKEEGIRANRWKVVLVEEEE